MDKQFVSDLPEAKRILDSLPITIFDPGQTVLTEGAVTGELLVLQQGALEIFVGDIRVATTSMPGAAFGQYDFTFGFPVDCTVRAIERCEFRVASQFTLSNESFAELREIARDFLISRSSG